jgi:hypothetical protein
MQHGDLKNFSLPLVLTIKNTGIKLFQKSIPPLDEVVSASHYRFTLLRKTAVQTLA